MKRPDFLAVATGAVVVTDESIKRRRRMARVAIARHRRNAPAYFEALERDLERANAWRPSPVELPSTKGGAS